MRFVNRDSVEKPISLSGFKVTSAQDEIAEYLSMPVEKRGQVRPKINSRIYQSVKPELTSLFDNKCAYCESPIGASSYMDVEHFRPKQNAGNDRKSSQIEYYSWLAYEWENLLISCQICSHNKGSVFPIRDQRGNIGASVQELRKTENGTLIDPCWDSPFEHLWFDFDGGVAGNSKRGQSTIDLIDLNRPELIHQRKRSIDNLFTFLTTHPGDVELYDTGAALEQDRIIFGGIKHGGKIAYGGAIANTFARILLEQKQTLTRFMGELKTLPTNERNAVLAHLHHYSSRPDVSSQDEGWSISSGLKSMKKNFTPKTRGGEMYRSQIMDDMSIAAHNIRKISIENFKILKDIEITIPEHTRRRISADEYENVDLAPCIMILGENATGKSSILEAIALALIGTKNIGKLDKIVKSDKITPRELSHRNDLLRSESNVQNTVKVEIDFRSDGKSIFISGESNQRHFEGAFTPSKLVLGYGPRRYFDKNSKYSHNVANKIVSLFDAMATISDPEEWLLDCLDKDFKAIVRALRHILMLENNDSVHKIKKDIFVDLDGEKTPFKYLSVGYKSVFTLAVDIMRELLVHYDNLEEASAVVLIDEIETHLHPRWKMKIMSALRQALPKVQFIVTTHDPLCLRGMYDGEVFVLRRAYDEIRQNYSGSPEIHTLSIKPGMDADDVLTSAGFGLSTTFIDEKTEENISEYAKLLLDKDRKTIAKENVPENLKNRLSFLRLELAKTVSGFSVSPIDELTLSGLGKSTVDNSELVPSNFESLLREALKAKEL